MKRRLACAALLMFSLAPVWAGSPATPVRILTTQFTQQEQILLAGVLADPAQAAEFARDAAGPATQALFEKWRQRIALFSRRYLDGPHPMDDSARSVKAMVPPAEWAMLMSSLDMLSHGGVSDQVRFHIFMAMLSNADEDLQADPPDTHNAHKVITQGRSKVEASMRDYLSSPTGSAALAEALRSQAVASTPPPEARVAARPKPRLKTTSSVQVRTAAQAQPQAGDKLFDGARAAAAQDEAPVPVVVGASPTQAPREASLPEPTLTLPSGLSRPVTLAPPPPPAPAATGEDDLAALRAKALAEHRSFFATARVAVVGAVAGLFVGRLKRRRQAKKEARPAPAGA